MDVNQAFHAAQHNRPFWKPAATLPETLQAYERGLQTLDSARPAGSNDHRCRVGSRRVIRCRERRPPADRTWDELVSRTGSRAFDRCVPRFIACRAGGGYARVYESHSSDGASPAES
jgi:hypothetical protein